MKIPVFQSLVLLSGLVLGWGVTPIQATAADKSLDVIIKDSVLPSSMGGGWTRSGNENTRYITMKQIVEKALKDQGYDGKLNFIRWGANMPDNPNQLSITIERWEEAPYSRGRSISVDFTMAVKLRLNGEESDLGRFSGRDSHFITGSGDSLADFGPAAQRAVEQAIDFYQDMVAAQSKDS
jgi:hypothetical protein